MTAFSPRFSAPDAEILEREVAYHGFFSLVKLSLKHRLFGGGWSQPLTREIFERGDAVAVLPWDPIRDELIFVEQFRPGALRDQDSPWMLELVAGMVESGEEPIEVAARESLEEANTKPQDLLQICEYYNSPGISNERITLFCGRVDATQAGGIFGLDAEHEDIEVVVLSLADALAKVASGEINNAMSIIALQWLQLNQPMLEESWK